MLKKRLTVIALACSLLGAAQAAETRTEVDDVVAKLVESGYMDVRSYEDEKDLVFTLENDRYILQASGLANAVRVITEEGLPSDKPTTVIATYYGVPKVSLTYVPVLHRWISSYRLDESWQKVRKEEKANGSFGKTDLLLNPQLSLSNLIITQVYQTLWVVAPTLDAHLWQGGRFSAQMKFPVHNSGFGARESRIHPSMITLSQSFRVPCNVNLFGKFTMGAFSNSHYGAALELFYPFPNERFSVDSQAGWLGLYYWDGFTLHMGRELSFYWNVAANYYWPKTSTQFTLRLQKFLADDYGIKYEMIRHFRHCSIGFYAEKGFYSDTHTNGGFRFAVTLPPYMMKRYRNLPKVTAGSMSMTYNANNEQFWYKEYKTEAGDNIMSKNAFNPYFIDSEIFKLNY